MSRAVTGLVRRRSSFPRVSGDEPQSEVTEAMEMRFSPRERG